MNIKEVEQQTGLPRSVIRFYEKEKLVAPKRNEGNSYRQYSGEDVKILKKIAFLRTLDISIDEIRNILTRQIELKPVLVQQKWNLKQRIEELNRAEELCRKMAEEENLTIDNLEIEKYTENLKQYWNINKTILKMDSAGFLFWWGKKWVWYVILAGSLLTALLFYPMLPARIPIQWNGKTVTGTAVRECIFIYPLLCFLLRKGTRTVFQGWLLNHGMYTENIVDYGLNCFCFLVLSVEMFTILNIYGILGSVTAVLAADTVVLMGALIAGWHNIEKRRNEA